MNLQRLFMICLTVMLLAAIGCNSASEVEKPDDKSGGNSVVTDMDIKPSSGSGTNQ